MPEYFPPEGCQALFGLGKAYLDFFTGGNGPPSPANATGSLKLNDFICRVFAFLNLAISGLLN